MCKALKEYSEHQIARAKDAYAGDVTDLVVAEEFKNAIVNSDYFDRKESQRKMIQDAAQTLSLQELRELAKPKIAAVASDGLTNLLSVQPDKAKIAVYSGIINGMWRKAGDLLKDKEKKIMIAPGGKGSDEVYSVFSHSARNRMVILDKITKKVTCNCDGYGIHKICGHTVAVAELNKVLNEYLNWHRENGMATSMTYLSKLGASNKTLGRKPNNPRRKKNCPCYIQSNARSTTGVKQGEDFSCTQKVNSTYSQSKT